jgi:hypothetical protein
MARRRQADTTAPADFSSVESVHAFLADVALQVYRGQVSAKVGRCLSDLAGVALDALQGGALARRVKALAAQVRRLKVARRGQASLTGGGGARGTDP